MEVSIKIAIKSAIIALEKCHPLGIDAELYGGAMKALRNVVHVIEEEEKKHDAEDEQR